jgi:hypothetical protein
VKGAVAYDWFFSSDNGATNWYYTTTTVASVTITQTIAANQAVPSTLVLPDVNPTVPTLNVAADNGSAQANEFDGFLASLTGDYNNSGQFVTSGTSNANGAVWIDGGGAALSLSGGSVTQIETVFAQLWASVKCSPTAVMLNAVGRRDRQPGPRRLGRDDVPEHGRLRSHQHDRRWPRRADRQHPGRRRHRPARGEPVPAPGHDRVPHGPRAVPERRGRQHPRGADAA